MNFIIEDIRNGKKIAIKNKSDIEKLNNPDRSIANSYIKHKETISMGCMVAYDNNLIIY